MESSELRNFYIRKLLSSEVLCSVARVLRNPVYQPPTPVTTQELNRSSVFAVVYVQHETTRLWVQLLIMHA